MKNKHLVVISFDTKAGGISNMIGIHALALVREGYKLSLILPKFSDAINSVDNAFKDNQEYNEYLEVYKFNSFDKFLLKLGFSRWIKKILNVSDACFVHNAKLIPIIKYNSKKPLFAVNHTSKQSQIKYYNKADLIYSVNKTIISELINVGIGEDRCIYCPNVLLKLPDIKLQDINKGNVTIGALGRMVEKKGFYDFIDALKILKERGYSFRAILAGDGVLSKELKKYAEDLPELDFPGWVLDKQEFFNKIDIFCQPSHFEPFGLTVIEAMSYGKPVISTDCDGPVEIINDNMKNGIIVQKKKPIEMADAIIKLMKNSHLHKNICNLAFTHVQKFYSLNSLQKKLHNSISNYFNYLHEK